MLPFKNLADFMYEKLHEHSGFHEEDKKYVKGIVDNAIHLLVSRMQRRCDDDETVQHQIRAVATNAAAFLALVIGQLEFFSRGVNDGPFFDMIRNMLDEAEDNNNSGHPPKE